MGALLESFATEERETGIGQHLDDRGILLLDPLDIHWPALIPLSADGPEGVRRQHSIVEAWGGLDIERVRTRVFLPAGYEWDTDHPDFRSYSLPVSDLTQADWAELVGCDLVQEPRGRLLDEAYTKVVESGWEDDAESHPKKPDYRIEDLIRCIEKDSEIADLYQPQTTRSLIQALRAFARQPLFQSSAGTPLSELIEPRALNILGLARLPASVRTVLTTVVIRRLRNDRMFSSQIQRRLALEELSEDERSRLTAELVSRVPRTILAIDEAQILLPASTSSPTRREIEAFVLEGRNYGLSLWLATQRPKGAISGAAISQIDTFIIHRLSVRDDIDAVCRMLQNAEPTSIKIGRKSATMADLIRSLDTGQAVFSGPGMSRVAVGIIRPRMVAHGGDSF